MTKEERRAHNQRLHLEQRRQEMAARGAQGLAEAWWDEARRVVRQRGADDADQAWADLTLTLTNFCARYSE